jgi:hypothetical protein
MKGRRILVTDPKIDPCSLVKEAGDYYGPVKGWSGDNPAVFFLLPIARDADVHGGARSLHHVQSPPHTFTEEPDGTLTIRASIAAGGVQNPYWHGHLTKGVWEKCQNKA